MHELSVCQALLTQVTTIARSHGSSRVLRISIEVGPLSGIDAGQLADAFLAMRRGSCAAAASLSVSASAIAVECLRCGARSPARANRLACAACSSLQTRLISGAELRLMRVEMSAALAVADEEGVG
jgi:hydrogenase nickel incorporation protein HypA/HybF